MRILLLAIIFLSALTRIHSQEVVPLYNDTVPNSISSGTAEKPTLTIYLPAEDRSNGTAVVVCPGGGYSGLAFEHEGTKIAAALNQEGIAAFVLKYRLPSDATMRNKSIGPLQDAQRAIQFVRSDAKKWKVDPSRIGIMGFSAGGHLASTAGTHFKDVYIPNPGNTSLRPDFMILVYPVISFMDSLAHVGSRTRLIGESPTAEQKKYFSNDLQVTDDTPPAYLVHAGDDDVVKVENSIAFYEALLKHHVPAELHLYQVGGHGFGIPTRGLPVDDWTRSLFRWLEQKDLLKLTDAEVARKLEQGKRDKENRQAQQERVNMDWAYLNRYREQNESTQPKKPGSKRIVFMGNSITEGWRVLDSAFFISNGYFDRGISGQTTPQMLIRFRPDVIDLHADVVVILAGINDIAQNTGPISIEHIYGNIISMVQLARANNIKVVLSSVLPAYDFPWHPGMNPAEKVVRLNNMIKEYAAKNKIVYLDYFSPMADERKGLKKELTTDGVHPNLEGYRVMEPLVNNAIRKALSQK